MQHRESDISKFFSHENQPFPHSLSDQGKLRFGKKSDLLEVLVHDIHSEPPDTIHARLLDGAAVVHLLPTVNVATFDEYADKIFLPHILKESTREKRGKGIRRKVEGKTSCLESGQTFLRDATKSCLGLFPRRWQPCIALQINNNKCDLA